MKRLLYLLFAILLGTNAAMAQLKSNEHDKDIDIELLRKLQIAQLAITQLYVDSVDQNKLVEDAINGMLEKLDPHSSYSNAQQTKKLNEPLEGNFEGIGVQFNMLEDTLVVIQTISKGPSEKAGIVAGDRFVTCDDVTIAGVKMERDSIMRMLRGPKGTKVKLGVKRNGNKDLIYFTLKRDKIPVNTLGASYMITPKTGYIELDRFGATSGKEVKEAIAQLQEKGMQNLILDLTANGGGYLGAAFEVADQFLEKNDLVVYTEGRTTPRQVFHAEGGGLFTQGKLAILVSEYSASAAEIVAGAIQDHDRGTIIGRRTFGKGLVQRPIDLPDGSMIRLTVSHYFTPAGRCIQKPYTKGEAKDYAMDVVNRLKHGELTNADSIHFADSLKCYTLRQHRTVYGGGGIMPDYFVPLDTLAYTKFHRELSAKSYIINTNLKYIDAHRKELKKKYKTFDDFRDNFVFPKQEIDKMIAEAAKNKVTPKDDEELQKSLPKLSLQLKALVARDLWDMSEYFAIINEESEIVRKAVEIIGN